MVLPFGNRVCSFDILGRYIWEALEYSSTLINDENTNLNHMIHISGELYFPKKFDFYSSKIRPP